MQDSNTYRLYQLGWRGLAIDAALRWQREWAIVRPRDVFIHQAIGSTTKAMYYCFDKVYATCSHIVDVGAGCALPGPLDPRYEVSKVIARPLSELLMEHQVPAQFDFLNVDCEGLDLEIVRAIDFDQSRPSVIAIEDQIVTCDTQTTVFLSNNGYRLAAMIGYTKIFQSTP